MANEKNKDQGSHGSQHNAGGAPTPANVVPTYDDAFVIVTSHTSRVAVANPFGEGYTLTSTDPQHGNVAGAVTGLVINQMASAARAALEKQEKDGVSLAARNAFLAKYVAEYKFGEPRSKGVTIGAKRHALAEEYIREKGLLKVKGVAWPADDDLPAHIVPQFLAQPAYAKIIAKRLHDFLTAPVVKAERKKGEWIDNAAAASAELALPPPDEE